MCMTLGVYAQTDSVSVTDAYIPEVSASDSLLPEAKKGCWFGRTCKSVLGFFTAEPDTTYIEPQLYNFTVMAQTTLTDDYFTIFGEDGNLVSFSPSGKLKLGPFFGWRWLFFGYVFNVNTIQLSANTMPQLSSKAWRLTDLTSTSCRLMLTMCSTSADTHIRLRSTRPTDSCIAQDHGYSELATIVAAYPWTGMHSRNR